MKTTTNSITPTTSGHRNRRDVVVKKRYRRNGATSTTSIPKTTKAAGTPRVKGQVQDEKKELYTISVEPALEAGHTYVIDIAFTGLLQGTLYGFYRSSYKDKNGTKQYVFIESPQFDSLLRFVNQVGS